LNKLNKANNEEIIKIGSFIHKKCKLRANSLIKNNSFINDHSNNYDENIDHIVLDNSNTHVYLVDENSNSNTNSTVYDR